MDTLPSKPASASTSETPEDRKARKKREKTARREARKAEASASAVTQGMAPDFGEDFIAFGFSDEEPSDVDAEGRRRSRTRTRDDSGSGKGKGRTRDATPEAKETDRAQKRERTPPPEREWDKGKRRERSVEDGGSAGKRKYGMVFDFDDGYANKKQRTDAAARRAPWVADVDWAGCQNVAEMLHREVEAFTKWISPTPVEDEVRGLVVAHIAQAVTAAFPDARVLPFGSYETKLYLPLGDIDLVILSDSMAYSDKVTVLHALANTLRRAGIPSSKVTIIAKAKVPIVKFVTAHGRFNVDISINQANGVVAGQIVNGFLHGLHGSGTALRSLVLITKAFLSQRSMNEVFTGGLGSYSIVCLAVSFLQMHPRIRRGEIDAEKNLGVLVMEFFELYGCYFNYEEVGISVRDGGTYFNKKQRGWMDYYKTNLLSIEDPADPSNDISKGSYGFAKVRATLAGAYGILSAAAYLRAGIISARRDGRSVRLRSNDAPEEMSILATVMGITQETINHRRLVQELYDKRVLHTLLGVQPKAYSKPEVRRGDTGRSEKPVSASSRSRAARSVQAAWETGEEPEDVRSREREREERRRDDEDEEGRYGIGRQPPKKRQRTGRAADAHTVFTTDDDDEGAGSVSDMDEEAAYDSGGHRASSSRDTEKVRRTRSYWLSKGIGEGVDSD